MKTQSEIKHYLCELIDNPEFDPIGFKREALLEYADRKTVLFLRRTKVVEKPKKGKRMESSTLDLPNWVPTDLAEDSIKSKLNSYFDRAWCEMKKPNTRKKGKVMYRMLDKIEVALWILEDQEALDFIREPDNYDHSAVSLLTWLSDRYSHVPSPS
jgi:hypothetical protein